MKRRASPLLAEHLLRVLERPMHPLVRYILGSDLDLQTVDSLLELLLSLLLLSSLVLS